MSLYHYLVRLEAILRSRQDIDLIPRCDCAPHQPHVETHPHHKHVGDTALAAQPPDLSDVLREIDAALVSAQGN